MIGPMLIDLGKSKETLVVDANYEFEFTRCKADNDCTTYKKKAYELNEQEKNLIIAELIKKQNMENQMPYYVTYKFFDEKKRRLAIFAIPTHEVVDGPIDPDGQPSKVRVYIIPCSKKDTFSKKRAKELFIEFMEFRRLGFDGALAHPIELQIAVKDDKPKFTFLKWCEENYFKYRKVDFALNTPVLSRGEEILDIDLKSNTELYELVNEDDFPQSKSEN